MPSADGLLQAPRWYHGPVVVPLAALTRICGPEPGMRRPEHRDHWRTRIAAMVQSIGAG